MTIYKRFSGRICGAPPAGVYGPVWAVLYILMSIAGWAVHRNTELFTNSELHYNLLILFMLLNIFFNKLWMPIFFGALDFQLAFVVILFVLSTGIVALVFMALNALWTPFVMWLIYTVWVMYATYLNFAALAFQAEAQATDDILRACDVKKTEDCLDHACKQLAMKRSKI